MTPEIIDERVARLRLMQDAVAADVSSNARKFHKNDARAAGSQKY